jgi:hypothetical protein
MIVLSPNKIKISKPTKGHAEFCWKMVSNFPVTLFVLGKKKRFFNFSTVKSFLRMGKKIYFCLKNKMGSQEDNLTLFFQENPT